jgi:hypothetical protein
MTFIDSYSWKCLLGPQAKEIKAENEIYTWKVGKRTHLATSKQFSETDLSALYACSPCNFNYLNKDNIDFLKKYFEISTARDRSVIVPLTDFSLEGGEFKKTRQAVNKAKKYNLTLEHNYRNLKDVEDMIEDWSTNYTDKYFRDFSGKNYFFYKNNFHLECTNIFLYNQNELVAYSSLSPHQDGKCSYIIGKALYKKFPGISELADVLAFQHAAQQGATKVDMGQAPKNLLTYKMKYPNAYVEVNYDGKILNPLQLQTPYIIPPENNGSFKE